MTKKHKKIADQIIPILRDVFVEERPCEKFSMHFQFGNQIWKLSEKEAHSFHIAARALSTGFPGVHLNTCIRELQKFCCEEFSENSVVFEAAVPAFLLHLESLLSTVSVVYVEISGIQLQVDEFSLGPVKLISSSHPNVDEHRLRIKDIYGKHPAPVDKNITLAQIEVLGEPKFAQEIACNQIQLALDAMQVLSLCENRSAFSPTAQGFILTCTEPIPCISCRQWKYFTPKPTWVYSKDLVRDFSINNPQIKLPINPETILKFEGRGLFSVRELLSTASPSAFDESIIAALKWISSAIREGDCTRRYLSLYIALEALFVRDNSDIRKSSGYSCPATPTDDGVAFLLGKTMEERVKIACRVRELSRTRNMIVHRGYTDVERNDLLTLVYFSWNCCIQVLKMRNQFQDENSFKEWCLRQKYGTP